MGEYCALLEDGGFLVECSGDRDAALSSLLLDIKGRLLMAEVASKLGKLPISIDGSVLSEAKRLLASAIEQVRRGILGYRLLVTRKVGSSPPAGHVGS